MTTQPATAAANVALVRSSLDRFNEGDIDSCVALLSPDFVMNVAGVPQRHGPDVWREGCGFWMLWAAGASFCSSRRSLLCPR